MISWYLGIVEPRFDFNAMVLEEGCQHTAFRIEVAVVVITLPSHYVVRHPALA